MTEKQAKATGKKLNAPKLQYYDEEKKRPRPYDYFWDDGKEIHAEYYNKNVDVWELYINGEYATTAIVRKGASQDAVYTRIERNLQYFRKSIPHELKKVQTL